jgi:ABC-type transport system involved in cytochrome c biogenesis ATPase subunit
MRLREFRVQGLFGLFNHTIPLNLEQRITIIHAPNGYGKTVILKLLSGFFGRGSLAIFRNVEFRVVEFDFDDGHTISFTKLDSEPVKKETEPPLLVIADKVGTDVVASWDGRHSDEKIASRRDFDLLDKMIPHIIRVGPFEFRDHRTGEILGYFDAVEQNLEYLPGEFRTQVARPDWLEQRRRAIHCQLIETQRLMTLQKRDTRYWDDSRPAFIPAVKTYSDELADLIEKTLADGGNVSSALDRTLPKRVLGRLGAIADPPSEQELRNRLTELEHRRARLSEVGLLDRSDDSALISQDSFDNPTRKFLAEYAADAEKKLDIYERILPRLELLKRIINDHFQFKTMSVERKTGFVFTDVRNKKVALDALSSGEQHELVLVYGLLFKTQPGTLLLVDEPEISLHVAWQKKFLSDLRQIITLSPMDVVLSTHSPQLIGGHLNLTTQLKAPAGI